MLVLTLNGSQGPGMSPPLHTYSPSQSTGPNSQMDDDTLLELGLGDGACTVRVLCPHHTNEWDRSPGEIEENECSLVRLGDSQPGQRCPSGQQHHQCSIH